MIDFTFFEYLCISFINSIIRKSYEKTIRHFSSFGTSTVGYHICTKKMHKKEKSIVVVHFAPI